MSTLHTINKSPFAQNTHLSCLKMCGNEDAVLLIENGVLHAIQSSPAIVAFLKLIKKGVKVYALDSDINARGLQKKMHPKIILTDYNGFVQLSIKHHRILSWY